MAGKATFDGFDPYKLTGVRVTDQKLGHGSYATVLELEYMGLKCAGKKIHELLLEQEDASYTVHRFEEECRILSQVRHPNIVQFLGVHFQERVQAPILVMEFLPTNLTSCIEQYGILPKEISYSILHDVALGLCYLHSQAPPIIHRDLSSNNILLTPNMIAKISDLGVARILNLTPLQISGMTQTPGTPAYMPPEVMVANPNYNTSVDEFSYGIMMIHMFSGRWPEPQVGQTRIEGGKLIPVTEAERREVFLNAIEENHPLMDLIHKCIDNNPQLRPHADEIIRQISQIASQFPASLANRLELLRRIERDGREKRALTEAGERKDGIILQNEKQILSLKNEVQQKAIEMERLRFSHSIEVEQLQLQLRNMKTQNEHTKAEIEAEIAELNSKSKILFEEREQSARLLREEQEQHTIVGIQLRNEREANRKLLTDVQNLQSEITTLQGIVSRKEATIKRKDTELEAKSIALGEKVATISTMSERITKAREYLATTKLQVSTHLKVIIICRYSYIISVIETQFTSLAI